MTNSCDAITVQVILHRDGHPNPVKLKTPFDFKRARRITPEEVERNRQAIEALTGKPRKRRHPKPRPTDGNPRKTP